MVTASRTNRSVSDIGSPAPLVPPKKYISRTPSQLSGGPGSPGITLPMIPTIPRITARTIMKVFIGEKD